MVYARSRCVVCCTHTRDQLLPASARHFRRALGCCLAQFGHGFQSGSSFTHSLLFCVLSVPELVEYMDGFGHRPFVLRANEDTERVLYVFAEYKIEAPCSVRTR